MTAVRNLMPDILTLQGRLDVVEASRTSVPTTGTWTAGSRVWNSTPIAGANIGWVCITAGTPGTWKQFGVVEA